MCVALTLLPWVPRWWCIATVRICWRVPPLLGWWVPPLLGWVAALLRWVPWLGWIPLRVCFKRMKKRWEEEEEEEEKE